MPHCYLILPVGWSVPYLGTVSGANVFATVTDLQNRELVSLNAVNEFPDIFKTVDVGALPLAWLDSSAFPQSEIEP